MLSRRSLPAAVYLVVVSALVGGFFGRSALATQDRYEVARVIGREVGSRNELTKDEASAVIDALEADRAALSDSPDAEPTLDAFPEEGKP